MTSPGGIPAVLPDAAEVGVRSGEVGDVPAGERACTELGVSVAGEVLASVCSAAFAQRAAVRGWCATVRGEDERDVAREVGREAERDVGSERGDGVFDTGRDGGRDSSAFGFMPWAIEYWRCTAASAANASADARAAASSASMDASAFAAAAERPHEAGMAGFAFSSSSSSDIGRSRTLRLRQTSEPTKSHRGSEKCSRSLSTARSAVMMRR